MQVLITKFASAQLTLPKSYADKVSMSAPMLSLRFTGFMC